MMYGSSSLLHLAENKSFGQLDDSFGLRDLAARRFWRFFGSGLFSRIRSIFGGTQSQLLDLTQITQGMTIQSSRYCGTRSVPINQIKGSEGKSGDFDGQFRPLKKLSRDRWIGIAVARLQGKSLPPVELLKVGDDYYVRDGHHRISVAKAYGQVEVDAVVTIWSMMASN